MSMLPREPAIWERQSVEEFAAQSNQQSTDGSKNFMIAIDTPVPTNQNERTFVWGFSYLDFSP